MLSKSNRSKENFQIKRLCTAYHKTKINILNPITTSNLIWVQYVTLECKTTILQWKQVGTSCSFNKSKRKSLSTNM